MNHLARRVEFETLADEWERETGYLPHIRKKREHPAYRRMVSLGEYVIPHALLRVARNPDLCFLLSEVTGENPVPADTNGVMRRIVDAWLRWGVERGHLTEFVANRLCNQ